MIIPESTLINLSRWIKNFENIGLPNDFIEKYYHSQKHRYYHTYNHVLEIIHYIFEDHDINGHDTMILLLTALYHDIVYDPKSNTNEENSANLFKEHFERRLVKEEMNEVIQIILETKTHKATNKLSKIFCRADLDILYRPLSEQIIYEDQIFKEFQFYDWIDYKNGRIKVLNELNNNIDDIDLYPLIEYVKSREPKIALYPGSFNPFSQGHLNILQKAERIFDKVIIGYGINSEKNQNQENILPEALKYKQVIEYDGLLTDLVKSLNYPVTIIRGLRNGSDLQYELNQYRFLQELSNNDIDVIFIFCDSEFEHISSSAIRQLSKYGKQDKYLVK